MRHTPQHPNSLTPQTQPIESTRKPQTRKPSPLFVRPKKPNDWEVCNIAAQLSFDLLVLLALGPKSLFYLVVGTLLGALRC